MDSRLLVVISGPIASGKSSAAEALAAGSRATGRSAASVDLDLLYKMIDAGQPMDNPSSWRQARRAAAVLADEFVLTGMDLVIVEGTFWTRAERDEFANHLATDIRPHFVTLCVSLPEALRRVEVDNTRRSSRDPAVLRSCHVAFAATVGALGAAEPWLTRQPPLPRSGQLVSTATGCRWCGGQVAAMIMASLELARSSGGRRALFRKVDCEQIPIVEAGLAFYRDALGSRIDLAHRHRHRLANGGVHLGIGALLEQVGPQQESIDGARWQHDAARRASPTCHVDHLAKTTLPNGRSSVR